MPVYSLIALLLSIFGATYTAISTFRSYCDPGIKERVEGVKAQVTYIGDNSGKETIANAANHSKKIKKWAFIWRFAHAVPIVFFGFATVLIAVYSLCSWSDITQPPSPIVVMVPLGLTADSPVVLTLISNERKNHESANQESNLAQCSQLAWWLILTALIISAAICFFAFQSRSRIFFHSAALEKLYRSTVETVERNKLSGSQPASS